MRDRAIGEDGKEYRRYAEFGGCWCEVEAVKRHYEMLANAAKEQREKRNANRVARGKRRKSLSSFSRSANRYNRYLKEDSGMSFHEWLLCQKSRGRYGV